MKRAVSKPRWIAIATVVGLTFEVPVYPGAPREGIELSEDDQGDLHPAVVPSSASSIRFEICRVRDSTYHRGTLQSANLASNSLRALEGQTQNGYSVRMVYSRETEASESEGSSQRLLPCEMVGHLPEVES